ncbi:hybrid sensor histidine kinase/response regulator [Burkholderia ubonensis]|uniref:hybrid sensor histidine kinase/response regulator n=1 Tax=Burkholderia ubonensis TaxID=101571 RepID=UPI0009B37F17|nr:hybrid sensor histidine kinase/response regulator [Burkholderia ubonensis]
MSHPSDHPKRSSRAAGHLASAWRASEQGALSRYQRGALFVGGGILSVVIVLAIAYSAYNSVRDYIAQGRATFLVNLSLLRIEIETRQALFSRTVASSELLWGERRHPSAGLMQSFSDQRGQSVVQAGAGHASQLAFGQVTPDQPVTSFAAYLGFTDGLGQVMSAAGRQRGGELSGFLYSPDETFISIFPPPALGAPFELAGVQDTRSLVRRLALDVGDLSKPEVRASLLAARGATWLPPVNDPMSGENVFRMVQPAFAGNEPFLIFVGNVPVETMRDRLRQASSDGELFVADSAGRIVMHSEGRATEADTTLAARALQEGAWRAGFDGLNDSYRDGIFTVSDRLPGTNWVLAYVWSWRTVVAALAPSLLARAGATAAVLCVLWLLLMCFDRKVFVPLYARSQRAFEAENLNRLIISMAPMGLGLFSMDNGRVLLENDVMRGYRSSSVRRTSLDGEQLVDLYRQSAKRSGQRNRSIERELSVARDDGSACDLLVSMVRGKYQGRDVLLCGIADITVRKNLERTSQQARETAEAANKARSIHFASMSHEIRAPLNLILGHLELLSRMPRSADDAGRLQVITSCSLMLLDSINDVLDFSKIESGQMILEDISFDLGELIDGIVTMFEPLAARKGLALTGSVSPVLPRCYRGDPTRIRQMAVNLVSNALKFTDHGYVTINVDVAAGSLHGSPLIITVADSGIGIPSDQQRQIFDAFGQADATIARRFGGTGLGLALCRKMAELMGGAISVSSSPGKGSTFEISLPLVPAREIKVVCTPRSPEAERAGPVHVLVVDDHELNRALLMDQLKVLGYTSDAVKDGLTALRQIQERHYDAVVTDLRMPEMDGYMLASRIRSEDARIPIFAVTAGLSADDHHRCRQVGISDVFQKPMSLASIDQIFREHVARAGDASARARLLADFYTAAAVESLPEDHYAILQHSSADSMEKIRSALEDRNFEAALACIHSLKGAFGMIQEPTVTAACVCLEEIGVRGDLVEFERALGELVRTIDEVISRRAPASAMQRRA